MPILHAHNTAALWQRHFRTVHFDPGNNFRSIFLLPNLLCIKIGVEFSWQISGTKIYFDGILSFTGMNKIDHQSFKHILQMLRKFIFFKKTSFSSYLKRNSIHISEYLCLLKSNREITNPCTLVCLRWSSGDRKARILKKMCVARCFPKIMDI